MNPVFVNVNMEFTGITLTEVYPPGLFNIYYGSQTLIFGRNVNFGPSTLNLSGTVAWYDTTLTYTGFTFQEEQPENSFVARMWAISYIDYWTSWMVVNGEQEEIIDQIIWLSQKYGILTDYTNYQGINDLYLLTLNGIPQGGGIMLNWALNMYEPGVTFDIFRSQNQNGSFTQINTSPVSATSFYDDSAIPGQVYYYKLKINAIDGSKFSDVFVVGDLPQEFLLSQNYPNPFNAVTEIPFLISSESNVRIEIFNLLGQRIKVLEWGIKNPGLHRVEWDGTDYTGKPAASGQYFYRLTAEPVNGGEPFNDVRKLTLLK